MKVIPLKGLFYKPTVGFSHILQVCMAKERELCRFLYDLGAVITFSARSKRNANSLFYFAPLTRIFRFIAALKCALKVEKRRLHLRPA